MVQYEVRNSRGAADIDPMTVTLSRPLEKNRLLIVADGSALSVPILCRDEEGQLIKKQTPLQVDPNMYPQIVAQVVLHNQNNRLEFHSYIPLGE